MANKVYQSPAEPVHPGLDVTSQGNAHRGRRARTRLLVVVLGLVLAVASGCSQAINVAALEEELASQIAVQRGVGVSAVKVVCPATVEVAEGSVAECSAVIDGQAFTATVTQTDGQGGMQWALKEDEAADVPSTDTSAGTDDSSGQ